MDNGEYTIGSAPTMEPDGKSKIGNGELKGGASLSSMPTIAGRTTPRGGRLNLGDVLLGRYTVLAELGEGGMGVVYKCLDTVGGIEVAVKCLPPELSRNKEEMEEIRENYAIVARLHHSAIAGLRQLEKDAVFGEYYLVMDLARGENLSAMLRRRRGEPMPLDKVFAILRPLASALDYAHGEKVLHRDVKPANVKVEVLPAEAPQPSRVESAKCKVKNADGPSLSTFHSPLSTSLVRVQLLDFGLAAEVRSSMSRVSLRGHAGSSGTPAYMAPEQWEAKRQSAATDQYSLAVMAYQMLSGYLPFDADDMEVLKSAVINRAPEAIEGLPAHVNAALMKALAKDPKDRFASCAEFVESIIEPQRTQNPQRFSLIEAQRHGEKEWNAAKPEPPNPKPDAPRGRRVLPWVIAAAAVVAAGVFLARSPRSPQGASQVGAGSYGDDVVGQVGGATRAEMEDALTQLESPRDALVSQEYAADDPERKPVEEAIAVLQSRIDAALDEKESLKAREAEVADRRAAAQRAIDLQSLSDLRKSVERRVSSLDATWNDGEFAKRRKAIADAQKALADCADASSLARAKELCSDIFAAADWIECNTPARAELSQTEKTLDAISSECAAADASTLAAASLHKAERARGDAEAKRDEGCYEEAATGYASARALYETARAEARSAKAAALVEESRAYGQSKMWEKSLAAAQKALEWDASSAAAQSLRDEAEKNLKPISVTAGERKVVQVGSQEVALRWCPPGAFTMGSPTTEEGRSENETQHRVTLTKGFWMGETEVTQGLWKEVVGDNSSYNKSDDNYPLENVSWDDCQEFLKKLNARSVQEGLRWALPTEAQWEYACRAGATDAYGGTGRLDDMGWYSSNSRDMTHPVAGKTPNAWGLHDMHGNVWEWCADWYGNYPAGPVTDPPGEAPGGGLRVLRGGSYRDFSPDCRSANRYWGNPGYLGRDSGFRLMAFQNGR